METFSKDHQEILKLNNDTVTKLLVDFIRDETTAAGLAKGVIGLSGGVDSAVVAHLTQKALGSKNTIGVIMPYSSSNPQSVADARQVVEQLGIQHELVDISPMVDSYCNTHKVVDRVRRGNIMARVRMIVLYDISARERALVIGTSNKTELLVGYGTIYGDMACALNPIGDLYKTQVWELATVLKVPEGIIRKKPTADLWPGQTDEEELGMSYRLLDRLLYFMIDERRTDGELKQLGFDTKEVSRIRTMVRKNQFKRRPPLIAKLSQRTLNVDFRYVRDWGM
jgi:NAD+ synthase